MQKSWRPFDETDYKLCSLMCDYVANFVKTQNPNGDNLPSWPATSKKQKGMKLFEWDTRRLCYLLFSNFIHNDGCN